MEGEMKKLLVCLTIVTLFLGMVWAIFSMFTFRIPGKYYLSIDQGVEIDRFFNNTYKVDTVIWLRDWQNFGKGVFYITREKNVKCDDIPDVKSTQMSKAKPYYLKAIEKLKTFKECEYAD